VVNEVKKVKSLNNQSITTIQPKDKIMKINKMILAVTLFSMQQMAQSAILTGESFSNTSQTAFPVSSADLVNNGATTLSNVSGTSGDFGSSITNINNGSIGNNSSDTPSVYFAGAGAIVTFDLNVTINTLGYDLSQIEVFTGWEEERVFQNFSIAYSDVTSASYVNLGTFSNSPSLLAPGAGMYSLRLSLTDSLGNIATGVDSIRFTFNNVLSPAYREIDIFGSASVVPEPNSAVLLIVSLGCLLLVMRQRSLTN
jgi:hypothetical protein